MEQNVLRLTKSPFPGMNPFFEDLHHWRGFYNNFASEIMAALVAHLGEAYSVQLHIEIAIEVKSPEKLRRVLIRMTDNDELVTIIEILSPSNKRSQGLGDYQQKRYTILMSDVHFVEIDLLRAGTRPGEEVVTDVPYDYATVVNRAGPERISEIWRTALNEPLPIIPIPLRYPDADIILDMNQSIKALYSRYGYERLIDYSDPIPKPKLRSDMVEWWNLQKGSLSTQT